MSLARYTLKNVFTFAAPQMYKNLVSLPEQLKNGAHILEYASAVWDPQT